ncbi:uncharacterized protein LOC130614783 [Hydractinia symbiolongicarpus]|uniref:uncharacterized protein LOC130614783 n=1 Tax=Hydractinia symbiolongicarpus TaxID=13093 RepID=UPI00254B8CB1|nr:uncharacterized protein LOC130614783 [Hydractinia symbiolongicarpus]
MADIEGSQNLAQAFAKQYYNTFDTNRAGLGSLFVDVSILTFEGAALMGKDTIMAKLQGLPFQTVQHVITTVDGQPTVDGGVIIHVLGQLKTDNDPPHSYSETFHLKKGPGDNYVILNQVFRLGVHHG